ncbi:DNA topoisomerase [Weissella oryzae SG25]|uniref:DNA topoisomerase n=1 Tax=Weissella oryzae (strain DSM 25784 / JCM 18191 / LMG 30913 / SG25) TaxID=1329250 RepID=A0A069CZ08_WEIOS|nr:DNA topoisomerase [Weissella oryzae]GAK30271.1 DNA topoisomerase [Weissella oryzae SG25]
MKKYLILTEKPSAAQNFSKALGGLTGDFADFTYQITNLRGHVMTLVDPEVMVEESLKKQYRSWQIKYLPWQLSDFSWQRDYIKTRNLRTGRLESTKKLVDELKKESRRGYDAIVIATDTDPSGEGELLAWEALEAIGWSGQVLRANFIDESIKELQKALRNLRDVSVMAEDGEYLKGEGRNRWDFASMQLTRIATTAAKRAGFKVVAREGRLKSVIAWKIYEQLMAIKNYVAKPFFEVKFIDPAGHIFTRSSKSDDLASWRFMDKQAAINDLANYHSSAVTNEQHKKKRQQPGRLLDLAGLAASLATRGFNAKEILATYQKMYEAQLVSYPRTEDKTITPEQFNELAPLADKIAALVGVDQTLLTHRQARSTHVKPQGSHGANRPGLTLPGNLASLSKYGPSGPAIYELLAKNYLAMLAEDYIYDHVTAELLDYPKFKTAFNIPIALNFKKIFDSQQEVALDDHKTTYKSNQVGPMADPMVAEGVNPKPQQPSTKWIMAFLEKNQVGTGATRVSTLAEMGRGSQAMLKENRGKLTLTQTGDVSAILVKDTWIASPKITKRLFEMMEQVGRFEIKQAKLSESVTMLVEHDLPIMVANAEQLIPLLGQPKASKPRRTPSEKITAEWQGQTISFAKEWSGHTFTTAEIEQLIAGQEITFPAKTKRGKDYMARGQLAKQTYKGSTFYGFKLKPKDK